MPSCNGSAALALLRTSVVSIAESVWPDFGSSAVAQGDFANIRCCSKPVRHDGQLSNEAKETSLSFGTFITWASLGLLGSYGFRPT